jgi:hypothetical protein
MAWGSEKRKEWEEKNKDRRRIEKRKRYLKKRREKMLEDKYAEEVLDKRS